MQQERIIVALEEDASMRLTPFSIAFPLALLSPAVLAEQPSPPPLSGPPPVSEQPASSAPARATEPASQGYTGAYGPPGPAPPFSVAPLPEVSVGSGLNVVGPDGISTRTVKAVPCSVAARETDGFTTCVGIPDNKNQGQKARRR
jgi:hypothetical protein